MLFEFWTHFQGNSFLPAAQMRPCPVPAGGAGPGLVLVRLGLWASFSTSLFCLPLWRGLDLAPSGTKFGLSPQALDVNLDHLGLAERVSSDPRITAHELRKFCVLKKTGILACGCSAPGPPLQGWRDAWLVTVPSPDLRPLEDLVTASRDGEPEGHGWLARRKVLLEGSLTYLEHSQDPGKRQNQTYTKGTELAKRHLRTGCCGIPSFGAEGSRKGVSWAAGLGHPGLEPPFRNRPIIHSTLPLGTGPSARAHLFLSVHPFLGLSLSPLWVGILSSGFANQLGSMAKLRTPRRTNAHERFCGWVSSLLLEPHYTRDGRNSSGHLWWSDIFILVLARGFLIDQSAQAGRKEHIWILLKDGWLLAWGFLLSYFSWKPASIYSTNVYRTPHWCQALV